MQLGDVYINLEVKGYNKEIVLDYDKINQFVLVETAGTSLPYMGFSFFTPNKEIANLFIENNKVIVSMGKNSDEAEKFTVEIINAPKNDDGSDSMRTVTAAGFIGDKSYMVDRGKCKGYKGNSLLVAKQVIREFKNLQHGIDSDFTRVNENQVVWRQLYETSASFMVGVMLHMNVQPSFPLFTFDKYGKFHIRDYKTVMEKGPVWTFTPSPATGGNTIQYVNNFNVDSYKPSYNLYSGYNKITEIYGQELGIPAYAITDNIPMLSSSEESEKSLGGNRIDLNKIQSANVHKAYMASWAYNTNKLMALSSMQGVLELVGYYPELKPTDLVYVQTPKEEGISSSLEGLYLIDTIMTAPSFRDGVVRTYVYVTRDNNNNIEDFITEKSDRLKIDKKFIRDLLNAVALLRVSLTRCSQIMDGDFISSYRNYITGTKNTLLRMFSIDGIMMDFTEQARFLQSALCIGNNFMNALLDMLFPEEISSVLRDFLIDKPTLRTVLNNYLAEYVPPVARTLVSDLLDSIFEVQTALNYIAEDNNITAREAPVVADVNIVTPIEPQETVENIIQDFENNTTGLDIPFPIIELTESQKLMPEEDLREYVASQTIDNLADLGYLDNLTDAEVEELKDILLGNIPINFTIINKINAAAGETLNYRFWGTFGSTNEPPMFAWSYEDEVVYTKTEEISEFTRLYNEDYSPYMKFAFKVVKESTNKYAVYYNDNKTERNKDRDVNTNALSQLTDFYIKKNFKDRYRTLPCTKLISATKNARLYFACPQSERNIKFYINSKRMELEKFPISLGYTDVYGNPIPYFVYYTNTGYNSNSVMMEIRQ